MARGLWVWKPTAGMCEINLFIYLLLVMSVRTEVLRLRRRWCIFLLECPCFDHATGMGSLGRVEFMDQLKQLVGGTEFDKWESLSKDERIKFFLGEKFWRKKAGEVHCLVQKFLASAWKQRGDFVTDLLDSSCSAGGDTGCVANGHLATAHN